MRRELLQRSFSSEREVLVLHFLLGLCCIGACGKPTGYPPSCVAMDNRDTL